MYTRTHLFHFLLACLLAVGLTACDQSSQKIDFSSGSNLTINGPSSLTVPNYDSTVTAEYMIRAFTLKNDYTWSVSGVLSNDGTRRDGEVLTTSTSQSGSYTVTATTTIDGEEYSGSVAGEADYPTVTAQSQKYNSLSTFGALVQTAGLESPLSSDDPLGADNTDFVNGWTAFAPSNTAFMDALDEDGNNEIGEAELPAPGVLRKVLLYHTLDDSLTSSEISSSSRPTLLHPEEELTLDGSAGTVEGTNQTVNLETMDIATSDGVMHEVDGVLLPASVVSINPQMVIRDTTNNVDSVAVEGTYVADGGFVALHQGTPSGNIIGVSDYLADGFHGNTGPIKIELNSQLSDSTNVVAMPHRDTNSDQQFTFDPNLGIDGPYVRGNSTVPVVDSAGVDVPDSQ